MQQVYAIYADGSHAHSWNGVLTLCKKSHPKPLTILEKVGLFGWLLVFILVAHLILKSQGL